MIRHKSAIKGHSGYRGEWPKISRKPSLANSASNLAETLIIELPIARRVKPGKQGVVETLSSTIKHRPQLDSTTMHGG
jgi:hypothetical protein